MRKINLLNHSDFLEDRQKYAGDKMLDFFRSCSDLAFGIRMLIVMLVLSGIAAPKGAKAFEDVKLTHLSYLLPKEDNFAKDAKRHDEPRKGEFDEIPLVPESQQPCLWQCDDLSDKEEEQTSSPVFEAIKNVDGAFHSKWIEVQIRHRQLGILESMIDNYRAGKSALPDSKKKLKRLQKIYAKNLAINEKDLELWGPLIQEASKLKKSIKKMVIAEKSAGKTLKRCVAPQEPVDIGAHINPAPRSFTGGFDSYAEDLPKGVNLLPYECADAPKRNPEKSSSRIFLAVDLLEGIVMEHVIAAMERERAYVIAKDRASGEIGASKAKRRKGLENVYKQARSINQKVLQGWLAILEEVKKLKTRVGNAIRQQTKQAKKIKRCRMPDMATTSSSGSSLRLTDELRYAAKANDVEGVKQELIKQVGNGNYTSEGKKTDRIYIAFAKGKGRKALDKDKKKVGRKIQKELGGGEIKFTALEKELDNGEIISCIYAEKEEQESLSDSSNE